MVKIVTESRQSEDVPPVAEDGSQPQCAPVDAQQPVTVPGDSEPEGKTILLAEDQPAIQLLITAFLRQKGFRVLPASSGREALDLARDFDGEIDLLLSDVLMPGMDGPTLALELKSVRPGVKTLLMSGEPGGMPSTMSENGLDSGFLQKPFGLPKLLEKVREMISAR